MGKLDQVVAIKIINKLESQQATNLKMVRTELRVLELLKGKPNVVQMRDTIQTKRNIYIVTDLCEKGTIADLIKQKRKIAEE